ncbi:MAG TPA: hypothetical protein VF459_16585 [Caulobacteraceae bacterium]
MTSADRINGNTDWSGGDIVRVERAMRGRPIDGLQGLLVSQSKDWVYFYVVDQLVIPNGFALLRRDTIEAIEQCDRSEFMKKALKLKGYEFQQPPPLELSGSRSILTSLMGRHILSTIYIEEIDPDVVYIGYAKVVGDVYFEISPLSPSAEAQSRNDRFRLSELTRIDFGGEYEKALQLVSDQD